MLKNVIEWGGGILAPPAGGKKKIAGSVEYNGGLEPR